MCTQIGNALSKLKVTICWMPKFFFWMNDEMKLFLCILNFGIILVRSLCIHWEECKSKKCFTRFQQMTESHDLSVHYELNWNHWRWYIERDLLLCEMAYICIQIIKNCFIVDFFGVMFISAILLHHKPAVIWFTSLTNLMWCFSEVLGCFYCFCFPWSFVMFLEQKGASMIGLDLHFLKEIPGLARQKTCTD